MQEDNNVRILFNTSDSRKSDNSGICSSSFRCSIARDNCDKAIIGTSNSLANIFKPRDNLVTRSYMLVYLVPQLKKEVVDSQ